jgi:hypothetical protein
MKSVRISVFAVFLSQTALAGVGPSIEQECSVLDSSGSRSTGGGLISVTAMGQPGSVITSEGGGITHYGGFLGCVTLLPNLDTDGDGLADEIDPDNDGDGLTDLAEVGGGSFMPNTVTDINNADSDGDGASDGDESSTMTNPLDAGAFLAILNVDAGGGLPSSLEWSARGGKSYNLMALDDLFSPGSAIVITNVTATGGISPWFETTVIAEDEDPAPPANRSYFIQVAP